MWAYRRKWWYVGAAWTPTFLFIYLEYFWTPWTWWWGQSHIRHDSYPWVYSLEAGWISAFSPEVTESHLLWPLDFLWWKVSNTVEKHEVHRQSWWQFLLVVINNHYIQLIFVECLLHTGLSSKCVKFAVLLILLWGEYYYNLRFTFEETGAGKVK